MFDYEAEYEFYRIKGLFNNAIDVPAVVTTFQQVYDDGFTFEGTPKELYLYICDWRYKMNDLINYTTDSFNFVFLHFIFLVFDPFNKIN